MTVKTINSDVESQDSLENLKTKIQDNTGIPIGQQKLLYSTKILTDRYSLTNHGIVEGSTIYFLNKVKSEIKICIKILNARSFL